MTPDDVRALFERTDIPQFVTTEEAATLLGLAPQTLRRWSCDGSGPLKPSRRINGRLRWSVAEIRQVLATAA